MAEAKKKRKKSDPDKRGSKHEDQAVKKEPLRAALQHLNEFVGARVAEKNGLSSIFSLVSSKDLVFRGASFGASDVLAVPGDLVVYIGADEDLHYVDGERLEGDRSGENQNPFS